MRVHDLASRLGTGFEGNGDAELHRAAELPYAQPGDLAFVAGKKFFSAAATSQASCLIVTPDFPRAEQTIIRVPDPRAAFAMALSFLYPPQLPTPGIHPTAIIGEGTLIGEHTSIGPYVVIGENCDIGSHCVLEAHVSLGDNITIGNGSRLRSQSRVYDGVQIGQRAIIHSGAVLGADGFGFAFAGGKYQKFPQVGIVILGDDVEIGANACVDRAAIGSTLIGNGTKLDNMVHIAHNCRIGNHVVIAAQTGISGGVVVEDYAVIGGQVGIGDKARIESKAIIGSGAGILTGKIVRGGQTYWGTPARPLKDYLEQLALVARLGKLQQELHQLRQIVQPEPAESQTQSQSAPHPETSPAE